MNNYANERTKKKHYFEMATISRGSQRHQIICSFWIINQVYFRKRKRKNPTTTLKASNSILRTAGKSISLTYIVLLKVEDATEYVNG